MSLPKFFSRVQDSIGPLAAGVDVRGFLQDKSVWLKAPHDLELHPFHAAGFRLLVNLCARLYPEIIIDGSQRIVEECKQTATEINPLCDVISAPGVKEASATLCWACPAIDGQSIAVSPTGWEVLIDLPDSARIQPTNMLVALSAGAIAASELFRKVFADFLANGRRSQCPGRFNVLANAPTRAELPDLPPDIPFGRVHLVGAGAVGQAAVYALARVSAIGTIVVIDPEIITQSNLQRYVLTSDSDIGKSKSLLVERALAKTSKIETISVESEWTIENDLLKGADTVCAAVDSADTRIAIQASLPRRIYNAWTQPGDIGWSRHESFGIDPCLACLYWPTQPRPSYHQNVARSLKQHELRILSYLSGLVPVDQALRPEQIAVLAQYPAPPEAGTWTERSLLDDVAETLGVPIDETQPWKGRQLSELYRDGICAGALVRSQNTEVPTEMAVPLAHQSVLAGIMLAVQLLVASDPSLMPYRPLTPENRLDLLSEFPQISARPRQRTPRCICSDATFIAAYAKRWKSNPLT